MTGFASHLGLVNLRVLFSQVGFQLDVTSGFVATLAGVYGAPLVENRSGQWSLTLGFLLSRVRKNVYFLQTHNDLRQLFLKVSKDLHS